MRVYYLRPRQNPCILDIIEEIHLMHGLLSSNIRQFGINWDPTNGGLVVLVDGDSVFSGTPMAPFNFSIDLSRFGGAKAIKVYGPAMLARYDGQINFVSLTDDDITLFQECLKRPLQR